MIARKKHMTDEPLTDELLEQLLAAPDPVQFAAQNHLETRSLADYLMSMIDKYGLERADIIREAGMNETYGYQIFMGQRNPGRNKVLQLTLTMKLTLSETNRALQAAGVNELYAKNRRDAIIIFGIDKGHSLQRVNTDLFNNNEETIC